MDFQPLVYPVLGIPFAVVVLQHAVDADFGSSISSNRSRRATRATLERLGLRRGYRLNQTEKFGARDIGKAHLPSAASIFKP